MATTFSGKMTPIEVDIWLSERIDSINTQIGVGDYTGALQAISDLQDSISGFASEAYVDARTGRVLKFDKANIVASFSGSQSDAFELDQSKTYVYKLETSDSEDVNQVFSGLILPLGVDGDFSISHAYYDAMLASAPVFLIIKHEGGETESKLIRSGSGTYYLTSARLTIYEMR